MLRIEIPTAAINKADVDLAGPMLAQLIRKVADRIESDIRIVPTEGDHEWNTETYREAGRFDGVLLGAVITLEAR